MMGLVKEAPPQAALGCGPPVPADWHRTVPLARELKALAHPVRLAILTRAGRSVCVCELEASLPVKQPTVSHHLRLLREAGLIEGGQRGVWTCYSVRAERLDELCARLSALGGSGGISD